MTPHERDDLIRRMEEAVLLPPHDPARQQVCREVVEAGDWAREHWLDLLRQDEQLRMDLLDVHPPAGLDKRLRALADESGERWVTAGTEVAGADDSRRQRPQFLTRRRWLGLAASVAGLASVGSLAWVRSGDLAMDRRFQSLGEAVDAHHDHRHPVQFASGDAAEVTGQFADAFEWPVRLPSMEAGYELVGASRCTVDGEAVLCTQWKDEDGQLYSVFQFCAPDHGLPREFERRRVITADSGERQVTFWSEAHCAYVMAADPLDPRI